MRKELGQIDIENLFKIYYEIQSIKKKHSLNYYFKIDEGTYETAIEFIGEKTYHPPISQDWSNHTDIFCPDLLDYDNKIIIEYEEEVGNRKPGAKLAKKGHHREGDLDTKRDTKRTFYYKEGGFTVLRIWESDVEWRDKLESFLLNLQKVQ